MSESFRVKKLFAEVVTLVVVVVAVPLASQDLLLAAAALTNWPLIRVTP